MGQGQRQSVSKLTRVIGGVLVFSALAGTLGGCGKPENKPTIVESSMSLNAPKESDPAASEQEPQVQVETVEIGEPQVFQVPFGRVTENVGFFKLGLTGKDQPSYSMKGRYIYCLSGNNGNYSFRKIDLENLDKAVATPVRVNGTATLLDYGVRCNLQGQTIFYDFNLHEIYRTGSADDGQNLVPYKDGYIIKNGAELRILHLDDDKPYRTLKSSNYVITKYHSTGDNTYLVLKDGRIPDSNVCTVYDVNRNAYYSKIQDNVTMSDIGMVRYASGRYAITSFLKPKTVSFVSKNPGRIGSSLFDGTKFFFFDEADCKIKYYVPSKQKICVLSEAEFIQGAELKGLYGSYVYAEYADVIYFIESAGQKEQLGDAYIKKIKKDTAVLKKSLEFHYRIKILTGRDVIKPARGTVQTEIVTNDLEIRTALNRLTPVLKKLNYQFFDEFKWNKKEGVKVLLTGKLTAVEDNSVLQGLSFTDQTAFNIALNVRSNDVTNTFCREIMHTIEHRMVDADTVFADWNRYNPEGFAYSRLSAGAADAPYVPENESDKANVYFTDSYACANAYEDRARIFAAMFMPESYGRNIAEYPNLLAKASGIKHVLMTYHPSLNETATIKSIP